MITVAVLALFAFLLTLAFTPAVRLLCTRLRWLDIPDANRKLHVAPIPRLGGAAVLAAYAGAFALASAVSPLSSAIEPSLALLARLAPATLIVFAVGLADDLFNLNAWHKLAGQVLAASVACLAGIRIEGIIGHPVTDWLGVALTIVWLTGCANAFNLIDGVDGVASGLGLFATVTLLFAALLRGDSGLFLLAAPLAGALVAFLVFNFNPASIFLGDCGSLWIGFMLGSLGVVYSQKSATALAMLTPLIALAVPLLDTALAITRRYLRRQPIFGADRGHIHHRLLDRGLTPRRVAALLYIAGGCAACLSLLQSVSERRFFGPIVIAFALLVWAAVHFLGYQEFSIAARRIWRNHLRSSVRSEITIQTAEAALLRASSVEQCWQALLQVATELRFADITFHIAGRRFHHHLDNAHSLAWSVHIPIARSSFIRFAHRFEPSAEAETIGPLASMLHRVLRAKAAEILPVRVPAAAHAPHISQALRRSAGD